MPNIERSFTKKEVKAARSKYAGYFKKTVRFIGPMLGGPGPTAVLDSVRPHYENPSGPTAISLEGIIAIVTAVAMCQDGKLEVENIHALTETLPSAMRAEIGLVPGRGGGAPTVRQIDYALDRLTAATNRPHTCSASDPDIEAEDCDHACAGYWTSSRILSAVNIAILQAVGIESTGVMALDSTDIETWATRRSRGTAADLDDGTHEARLLEEAAKAADETNPETVPTKAAKASPRYRKATSEADRRRLARLFNEWSDDLHNKIADPTSRRPGRQGPTIDGGNVRSYRAGFPQATFDRRIAHCCDPTAREGWRSGRNGERGGVFLGRDLHAMAEAGVDADGKGVPVIWSLSAVPAGSAKGGLAVDMVKDLLHLGVDVTELSEDRAYSTTNPETHHIPLRSLGIAVVFDLHSNQRGGTEYYKGLPFIDGTPFTNAVPQRLRDLDAAPRRPKKPRRPGKDANRAAWLDYANRMASYEERLVKHKAHVALFDERFQYGFTRNGRRARSDGSIEYIGPGRRGTVDCPNATRPCKAGAPPTNCVPGLPCDCSRSVTVPTSVIPKTRQHPAYGTTAWRQRFNRRVLIESAFKAVKVRYQRGTIKAMGAKGTLLADLMMLGISMRMLRTHMVAKGNHDWIAAFRRAKVSTKRIRWTSRGPVILDAANPDRDDGG